MALDKTKIETMAQGIIQISDTDFDNYFDMSQKQYDKIYSDYNLTEDDNYIMALLILQKESPMIIAKSEKENIYINPTKMLKDYLSDTYNSKIFTSVVNEDFI